MSDELVLTESDLPCLCWVGDSRIVLEFRFNIEIVIKIEWDAAYPYITKKSCYTYAEPVSLAEIEKFIKC